MIGTVLVSVVTAWVTVKMKVGGLESKIKSISGRLTEIDKKITENEKEDGARAERLATIEGQLRGGPPNA